MFPRFLFFQEPTWKEQLTFPQPHPPLPASQSHSCLLYLLYYSQDHKESLLHSLCFNQPCHVKKNIYCKQSDIIACSFDVFMTEIRT